MGKADKLKKAIVSISFMIVAALLVVGPTSADDTADLVRQIQKSFSSIQREIVTKPKQAEKKLTETIALFEELKAADPENLNISRLEKKIEQLNEKLAKRLGKTVKPVPKSLSPAPPPPKEAPRKESSSVAQPAPEPIVSVDKGDELPGGVTSRIKRIDKALDKVAKALDKNSIQRAEFEFKNVGKTRKEIQDRYGDKVRPDHPEMVALDERILKVENRLKGAVSSSATADAAAKKAKDENAALANEWIGKLGAYIRGGDKELESRIWLLKGEQAEQNRRNYDGAVALVEEYEKIEFPLGKTMELRNSESTLKDVLKRMKEGYGKEETEKGSEEWVRKLEPFVTPISRKQLIASYTSNVDEMQHQKKLYKEASALFEQYLQVTFPEGKSPKLQKIEDELADELAKFPEIFQRSVGDQVKGAEKKIDEETAFLKSAQEWKNDSKEMPYTLSDDRINEARKLIDRTARLLPADDPDLARLNKKMAALIKMNDERRKVRAERTSMIAEKYEGKGKKDIKTKASELVRAKFPEIKILRTAVISEDWKEETVKEWTDTSKTAVRIRTTRSVTAQVAGKKSNGEVRLYTLYIAKNRRSDGTWGKLYGNLHSDEGDLMLEKNVNR